MNPDKTENRHVADSLRRDFVAGIRWPIDHASLVALMDMGMSPNEIGDLFEVSKSDVISLTDRYGIAGGNDR